VDWRGLARRDVSYGRDKDCSEIFKVLLLILCAQPSWTRTSLYRMWSATACPRDARSELRSLGGSPLAPSGVYPRPSGTGHPGSPGPLPDPRGQKKGVFPGFPGEGPKRHFLGYFRGNPRFPGFSGSRAPEGPGDPRRYRGATPGSGGTPPPEEGLGRSPRS